NTGTHVRVDPAITSNCAAGKVQRTVAIIYFDFRSVEQVEATVRLSEGVPLEAYSACIDIKLAAIDELRVQGYFDEGARVLVPDTLVLDQARIVQNRADIAALPVD